MPDYQQFEMRHRDSGNYMVFVDSFVRRVVGCSLFDRYCDSCLLSTFVNVSDEAFALLVYENQEERWKQFYEKLEKGETKPKIDIPGKYTDGGTRKGKDGGTNRNKKGWKGAGLTKFNQLCQAIKRERETDERKDFEVRYLRSKSGSSKKKKPTNKKFYVEDDEAPEKIYNEMEEEVVGNEYNSDMDGWLQNEISTVNQHQV